MKAVSFSQAVERMDLRSRPDGFFGSDSAGTGKVIFCRSVGFRTRLSLDRLLLRTHTGPWGFRAAGGGCRASNFWSHADLCCSRTGPGSCCSSYPVLESLINR